MIAKLVSRFRFQPDSAKRYFIVNYQFNEKYRSLANEKMMEKQKKYWQSYEDNQFLIFCGKDVNQTGMSMIFHCADERVPHKFVKEDPSYLAGAVEEFTLEELELRTQQESKAIATIYKYR